jgi:hypothetical protein
VKRLRDVIIGAQLEPQDLVDVLVPAGEEKKRGGRLPDVKLAADLEARHRGQVHVKDV